MLPHSTVEMAEANDQFVLLRRDLPSNVECIMLILEELEHKVISDGTERCGLA